MLPAAADPFADEAAAGPVPEKKSKASKADSFAVHVRMQQRNGRKSLTTVQVRKGAPLGSGCCGGSFMPTSLPSLLASSLELSMGLVLLGT